MYFGASAPNRLHEKLFIFVASRATGKVHALQGSTAQALMALASTISFYRRPMYRY